MGGAPSCPQGCTTCNPLIVTICQSCSSSYAFNPATSTCTFCDINNQKYLSATDTCESCDSSCKTCSNSTANSCLSCLANSELITQSNSCRACLLTAGEYYDSASASCKTCPVNCSECSSSNVCKTCINNTNINNISKLCSFCPSYTNPAIFAQNTITGTCACADPTKYIKLTANGTLSSCETLSQSYLPGYFCDSSTQTCKPCLDTNCNQCDSTLKCLQCIGEQVLIDNTCFYTCQQANQHAVKTQILINSQLQTVSICECNAGYSQLLIQETPQKSLCVAPLAISSLKAEVNTLTNMNTVVLCLNRVPYEVEYAGILIELKTTSGLTISSKDTTCKYVTTLDSTSGSGCIARVESVTLESQCIKLDVDTAKLIRVNEVDVSSDSTLSGKIFIPSPIIFMPSSYNSDHASDQAQTEQIQSLSNVLSGDNSFALMNLLKSFQLLCLFSNFIQAIAPVILLQNSLPATLKASSSLAAAFLFPTVPDSNSISYSIGQNNDVSNDVEQSQFLEELSILKSYGLTPSIYSGIMGVPHILLVIACAIMIFCISFRLLMDGKQYTLPIFTFLLNFQSDMQQGSITFTVSSIAYSIMASTISKPSASTFTLATTIISLICNIILQILIIFSLRHFQLSFIEMKLPNLIHSINPQAKGSLSYLSMSFLKKYLFTIMIIILAPYSPFAAALSSAVIFGVFTIYIGYFRFFAKIPITIIRIVSELFAMISFTLLAICIKLQEKINSTDDASVEDMNRLSKCSFYTMILFAICILLSFIRFLSSSIGSVIEMVTSFRNYVQNRKYKAKQIELEIQMYLHPQSYLRISEKSLIIKVKKQNYDKESKQNIIDLQHGDEESNHTAETFQKNKEQHKDTSNQQQQRKQ